MPSTLAMASALAAPSAPTAAPVVLGTRPARVSAPVTSGRRRAAEAAASTLTVLLAGGQGSRLHELTEAECKPAVYFAGRRRIVDFAMANAVRSGLGRMLVATQYRPEGLTRHLRRRWAPMFAPGEFELRCGPEVTGTKAGYRGTADAVRANLAAIEAAAPETVLVLAADHVHAMDCSRMLAAHRRSGAAVTVAATTVPRAEASGFGVLATRADGRVTAFLEKPADPPGMAGAPDLTLASMGIYAFDWPWLRDALRGGAALDFGHDVLPRAVLAGEVHAWRFGEGEAGNDYWRDVGTLDAYLAAQLDFAGDAPPCALPDIGAAAAPLEIALRAHSTRWTPEPGRNAGAGATMRDSVLLPGASVGDGARITRTIAAPDAHLPAGLVIGENPDEDARWFRRTAGGTVLVTPAMLARREADRPRLHPSLAPRRHAGPAVPEPRLFRA